jgi:hypothetical protein
MSTASATASDGQSRFVSVLLGAAATVALSFLPFAPLLGGGVAAYLREGDRREGIRVGALAGVVASVPVLAVLGVVFGGFSLFSVAAGVSRAAPIASLFAMVAFLSVLLVATLFVLVLVVGQCALGGWLAVVLVEQSEATAASAPEGEMTEASIPDDEDEASIPDDEDEASIPDDEDEASIPDDEDEASIPDDEDDSRGN